ncbi:MAG TPA: hypothetical protein VKP30_21375 [Polyangiaceae bacterium]|nr:hypothetical protein [Polyangiaceae bacterium]
MPTMRVHLRPLPIVNDVGALTAFADSDDRRMTHADIGTMTVHLRRMTHADPGTMRCIHCR